MILITIVLGLRAGLDIKRNNPYLPPQNPDEDDIPHIDDLRY